MGGKMTQNDTVSDVEVLAGLAVRSSDTTQEALNLLHGTFGLSWRKIAALRPFAEIGIPHGTLHAVAREGVDVIPVKFREAFNLPRTKPAPVCKCGEVHTTKRCTKYDKPRVKRDLFSYSAKDLLWMLENRS